MNDENVNPFLPILYTWKDYFENHYEGLGTTYERVLLHKIFKEIDAKYNIRTVLEVPSFGMTGVSGINSVWWALHGKAVTLVDTDQERLKYIQQLWEKLQLSVNLLRLNNFSSLPFQDEQFDLSWNFAALWFVGDLQPFAKELQRVSRKVILISVPNFKGWGYRLRERFAEQLPQINLQNIRPDVVRQAFTTPKWELVTEAFFDVPPWPDIAMKKEELAQKLGLAKLLNLLSPKRNVQAQNEAPTIVDFYSGKAPELEEKILRFAVLEKAPRFFQTIWAHHRYFVFRKTG